MLSSEAYPSPPVSLTTQTKDIPVDKSDDKGDSPHNPEDDVAVCSQLGPEFVLSSATDAAFLLFHIINESNKPPTLSMFQCLACIADDPPLRIALENAYSARRFDEIRCWRLIKPLVRALPQNPGGFEGADQTVGHIVQEFLNEIRPHIRDLLKYPPGSEPQLKYWRPNSDAMDHHAAEFLSSLNIPLFNNGPSLLLHELGTFQDSPELANRLGNIFSTTQNTFLVNSSGSGKTRLTIEGLCAYWGFYFSALIGPNLFGSRDLYDSMTETLPQYPGFSSRLPVRPETPAYTAALERNRVAACHVFSRVLLARLLIFNLFLEIIADQRSNMAEARLHKTSWLLLQLFPKSPSYTDIFASLTNKLSGASEDYLKSRVRLMFNKTRVTARGQELTEPQLPPFFCVIDEAQHAAAVHCSAFRSESGSKVPRPVLREITRGWMDLSVNKMCIIISGTGVSNEDVDHAFASAHSKKSNYEWCSDTGAFDTPTAQADYLCKYTPPSVRESPEWHRLLERTWRWCRGRHRSTSAYLELLMSNGFRRPHQLLNKYIRHCTGFSPTDAEECGRWEAGGPVSAKTLVPRSITFDRLERDLSKKSLVEKIVTEFFLRSVVSQILGADEEPCIQYGFARYKDLKARDAVIDEPLYILAAVDWMKQGGDTVYSHFANRLLTHSNWASSNGFEDFLAYGIYLLFGEPRPFCDVVKFCGPIPEWAQQAAQLVSLYQPTEDGRLEEADVGPCAFRGPSATIGVVATSPQDTLDWLRHKNPTPICFPDKNLGPDIICILRFADGSTAWWMIQAKMMQGSNGLLARADLTKAIASLDPQNFFVTRTEKHHCSKTLPKLVEETRKQLASLPRPRTDLGRYNIIRTVAAFPADAGFERAVEIDEDQDGHPLLEFNMDALHQVTKDLKPTNLLEQFMTMYINGNTQKQQEDHILTDSINPTPSRPTSSDLLSDPRASILKKRTRSAKVPQTSKRAKGAAENAPL